MCKYGDTKLCKVYINKNDSHTGKGFWCLKAVDNCLVDLVIFLNDHGLYTRSCCCGHGKNKPTIILQEKYERQYIRKT